MSDGYGNGSMTEVTSTSTLMRIFVSALELFEGNEEATRRWLAKPNQALGGTTPLSVAKTEIGVVEVERLIGRLKHGVFT